MRWLLCEHINKGMHIHETYAYCIAPLYRIYIEVDYTILLNEMVHHGPLDFWRVTRFQVLIRR